MRRFIHRFSTYQKVFDQSIANPVEYWGKEAKELSWFKFPQTILDDSHPPFYRWYKDGKTNISYNLLDRNLERNLGKQIAYHVESPLTGKVKFINLFRAQTSLLRSSTEGWTSSPTVWSRILG